MVKLKAVKKNGKLILADCYIEGTGEGYFYLEIDIDTLDIVSNSLGEMNIYVWQAVNKIREHLKTGNDIPDEITVMWC